MKIFAWIDLPVMLVIDFFVVLMSATVLLRYARLSHSHPATIYLFFHLYTFTLRLIGLMFGAPTIFSQWGWVYEPVTDAEIVRAAFLGDLALISMTVAWVRASLTDLKKSQNRDASPHEKIPNLSLPHIWSVVAIAFPLGLLGLWAFTNLPGLESEGLELGEWQSSSWFFITQVWAGLSILALIYWYGFRWWLMIPMSVYLLIMTYQGYHRFRVIIPAILMIQIYLDRRKLKWPPVYIMAAIFALMLIFFPLKNIGQMAQEGAAVSEIVTSSTEDINKAFIAKAPDQQFLDQYASALTLIDDGEKFYYGATYLPLVTLPIPRQWWPDKPGLADYLRDISKPWRPMAEMGMIVTFLGESYANFGYLGIIVLPYFLAYLLGRMYFRAYRRNYFSVTRLAYLLIACNLLQVYRDGLVSIVVFTWVNMMPLMGILTLHIVLPLKTSAKKISALASANQPTSTV